MRTHLCRLWAAILITAAFTSASALSDNDYINFALNVEYLSANYYTWASNGTGISTLGLGGPEAVGGTSANFTTKGQTYVTSWSGQEMAHIAALQQFLGPGNAVAPPALNIGDAFASFMDNAMGSVVDPRYVPYSSDVLFTMGAFIFQDVMVTMYNGLLPLLNSTIAQSLVQGLLGVEATRAAAIRATLLGYPTVPLFFSGSAITDIVAALSNYRHFLDPATGDAPLTSGDGLPILIPVNEQALPYARSPSSVLAILCMGGSGAGGFFPSGLGGTITR